MSYLSVLKVFLLLLTLKQKLDSGTMTSWEECELVQPFWGAIRQLDSNFKWLTV